jgi:hypothetical protein
MKQFSSLSQRPLFAVLFTLFAVLLSAQNVSVAPRRLEFGATAQTVRFKIFNSQAASLSWSIESVSLPTWLEIQPLGGNIAPGQNQIVEAKVNRMEFALGDSLDFDLALNAGALFQIPVRAAVPFPVPAAPSRAWVEGRQLMLQRRLPDGCLALPEPMVLKGWLWSAATVETPDHAARKFAYPLVADFDLAYMRAAHANTVTIPIDFDLDAVLWKPVLDKCWQNGIMAIIMVDNAIGDTVNAKAVVQAMKSHPAVLAWSVANEWNINHFYQYNNLTVQYCAEMVEKTAKIVRSLDPEHPVTSYHGDLGIPNQSPNFQKIVQQICPSIQFWGINSYKGQSFGDLFTQYAALTDKPMFMSEFGVDSYHTDSFSLNQVFSGYEDEAEQAEWDVAMWQHIAENLSAIDASKVCLGGTVFEWQDEYWKVLPAGIQNNGGYWTYWNPNAFPDSFANEEYFGSISIAGDFRRPKEVWYALRDAFALLPDSAPIAPQILEIQETKVTGGSILKVVTNTSAQTFLWSNGGASDSIIVAASGVYTVTVTFGSGCTASATYGFVATEEEENVAGFSMSIAPNPALGGQTTVLLTLPNPCVGELVLSDLQGRIVRNISEKQTLAPGTHFFDLDTNSLPPGVYICFFRADNWAIARNVILL